MKLKVGASNDSFQSALTTKDGGQTISMDDETISMDEETISREDEEAKLGEVGGIAKKLGKSSKVIAWQTTITFKTRPEDKPKPKL